MNAGPSMVRQITARQESCGTLTIVPRDNGTNGGTGGGSMTLIVGALAIGALYYFSQS